MQAIRDLRFTSTSHRANCIYTELAAASATNLGWRHLLIAMDLRNLLELWKEFRQQRPQLALGSAVALSAMLGIPVRFFLVDPSWKKLLVALAVIQGLTYIALMCRSAIHANIGYFRRRQRGADGAARPGRRSLRALSWLVVAVNGAAIVSAVRFAVHPAPIAQAVCALALVVATYGLSDAVLQAAKRVGPSPLATGRQWIRDHLLEQAERQDTNLVGRTISSLIRRDEPTPKNSRFTGAALAAMLAVLVLATCGIVGYHPKYDRLVVTGHRRSERPGGVGPGAPLSTPRTSLPQSPTPSAPPAATSAPTYQGLCGSSIVPGDGAPESEQPKLYDLWLGPGAPGGAVAACADMAQQEPGRTLWFATAFCQGQLRSIGVSPVGQPATLVLGEQPAQFVLNLAEQGLLLDVQGLRAGDGQIILADTPGGTWALIQAHRVRPGSNASGQVLQNCADVPNDAVAFSVIPPSGLELLLREAGPGWSWPLQIGANDQSDFTLVRNSGAPDGELRCRDIVCSLFTNDGHFVGEGFPQHITLAEVAASAPPA